MSNKRIKTFSISIHDASESQENGVGIHSMPHELLLEILQYLGQPLDLTAASFDGKPPYPLNTERRRTLHSLSQCCRALRSFFLPLAWEYFDACRAKNGHGECEYGYGSHHLESKSRGLLQNSNLAAYVRVVNVHITKSSEGEVLSTFAQCLQSLPNVHTLQIAGVVGRAATAIKTAFKGYCFLHIRTVILPFMAHHFLSSCPEVRDVICIGRPKNFFLSTIAKGCKQLEALDIMVYMHGKIELVVKATPNLCRIFIRFRHGLTANMIYPLVALPRLHTIILWEENVVSVLTSQAAIEASFQPLIQAATDILKKHEGDKNGKKWVRVRHRTTYYMPGIEDVLWTKDVEVEP